RAGPADPRQRAEGTLDLEGGWARATVGFRSRAPGRDSRRSLMSALYLDTSAVLRSIVESGTSPDVEARIRDAAALITSRLALVEASRAFHRLRQLGRSPETRLADAEREV